MTGSLDPVVELRALGRESRRGRLEVSKLRDPLTPTITWSQRALEPDEIAYAKSQMTSWSVIFSLWFLGLMLGFGTGTLTGIPIGAALGESLHASPAPAFRGGAIALNSTGAWFGLVGLLVAFVIGTVAAGRSSLRRLAMVVELRKGRAELIELKGARAFVIDEFGNALTALGNRKTLSGVVCARLDDLAAIRQLLRRGRVM